MPPRVMLLIPSLTYRAPDFMNAASGLDIEVVVASDREQVLQSAFPGRTLTVDFGRSEHGAEQIAAFAALHPLQAVLALDDAGTLTAAHASERLGLRHNPVEAVAATRSKLLLRQKLAAAGIKSPLFQLVNPGGVTNSTVPFPCVVKPLSLAGSRGVIRADDARELASAIERSASILEMARQAGDCDDTEHALLVEGYIPGREVSVEGLLASGRLRCLALFDKPDPLEGPFFEETIYVTPSRLPKEVQQAVIECAERAALALGLEDGPLHAELRVNSDGVWPIDIAARSIGGHCSRALTFGTGMSLEEILLRHAIGEPLPTLDRESAASGVMMIPIPEAGVLERVEGITDAMAVPDVTEVDITTRRGGELVPLPEGSEYLGFIFARAATPEAAEEALREAHRRLRIEMRR